VGDACQFDSAAIGWTERGLEVLQKSGIDFTTSRSFFGYFMAFVVMTMTGALYTMRRPGDDL